jgi:hypothetical protein
VHNDARRALLAELIDHAPLFPPASLPLEEALEDHRRAHASSESWMVARFVCPASRVAELPGEPLRLSVVADGEIPDDERIEAVEGRGEPDELVGHAPETYVEIPTSNRLLLEEIAATGARAKVRCGPEAPPVAELAGFISACRSAGIPFKATAGLHHAVRTDGQHGFLNLLAAAVFGDEERALAENDRDAFGLDASSFSWDGRQAGPDELTRVRRRLFVSIGSCSFTEPVDELKALGIL